MAHEEENPTAPTYRVRVEKAEHSSVKASPSWAWAGRKVQLTIQPDAGYEVDSITVTTGSGKTVAVSGDAFIMPEGSVTVRVTFKAAETGLLFPDVSADAWYSEAVAWAAEEGISDGTNPEGTITRKQLAAMLYRYSGSPETAADLSGHPDSGDVSVWAADAMAWAVESGLITGGDGGKLLPGAGTDRAQLAAILMRFARQTEG